MLGWNLAPCPHYYIDNPTKNHKPKKNDGDVDVDHGRKILPTHPQQLFYRGTPYMESVCFGFLRLRFTMKTLDLQTLSVVQLDDVLRLRDIYEAFLRCDLLRKR